MFLSIEDKQKKDEEIKHLYKKLVNKITEKHQYIEKQHMDYSPAITSSLSFLLNQSKLNTDELMSEFSWFINRMDAKILNGFGDQNLIKSIQDFVICGGNIEIFIRFSNKPRFKFEYDSEFFTTDLLGSSLERIKFLEDQAVKRFGYNKDKWVLQETFSGSYGEEDGIKKREVAYKKFILLEFLKFEEHWQNFLIEKDKEIKKSYQEALREIVSEVEKGDFEWLQLG